MDICPIHNVAMVEKVGQYGSYFSHIVQDVGFCNGKKISPFKAKPAGNSVSPEDFKLSLEAPTRPQKPTVTREPIKDPDWDAIARGKVRHGIAVAFIPLVGAFPVDSDMVQIMETWVDYVMGTQTAAPSEDIDDLTLPSESLANRAKD